MSIVNLPHGVKHDVGIDFVFNKIPQIVALFFNTPAHKNIPVSRWGYGLFYKTSFFYVFRFQNRRIICKSTAVSVKRHRKFFRLGRLVGIRRFIRLRWLRRSFAFLAVNNRFAHNRKGKHAVFQRSFGKLFFLAFNLYVNSNGIA